LPLLPRSVRAPSTLPDVGLDSANSAGTLSGSPGSVKDELEHDGFCELRPHHPWSGESRRRHHAAHWRERSSAAIVRSLHVVPPSSRVPMSSAHRSDTPRSAVPQAPSSPGQVQRLNSLFLTVPDFGVGGALPLRLILVGEEPATPPTPQ